MPKDGKDATDRIHCINYSYRHTANIDSDETNFWLAAILSYNFLKTNVPVLSFFDVTLMLAAVCMLASVRQDSVILIRLKNDSPYAMAKVEILSPASGLIHFGEIKAKQESSYKPVLDAYVTTAVYAEIEGKQIVFLPDDYLGEQHLSAGKYTFSLTVTEVNSERYLRVKLIVDQAKKK